MEVLGDGTPLDIQLLYKLQNELYDLHDRLQDSENANASRVCPVDSFRLSIK